MKKLFLLVALFATTVVQIGFAQQHDHASDKTSGILPAYYSVKDALVAGKAALASVKAEELIKTINNADEHLVNKAGKASLLEHATKIAASKDMESQRGYFADLSEQMIALAKTSKLSTEPVYQQYCPMKKTNWLSREKDIKNPYYGSSMLTCGKVVETIK
ncbi:MAG: DUF3347 domain-containing protein [Taibaiella sp.]|jgi:hypothetical protein